jgi:hypothetical protein
VRRQEMTERASVLSEVACDTKKGIQSVFDTISYDTKFKANAAATLADPVRKSNFII